MEKVKPEIYIYNPLEVAMIICTGIPTISEFDFKEDSYKIVINAPSRNGGCEFSVHINKEHAMSGHYMEVGDYVVVGSDNNAVDLGCNWLPPEIISFCFTKKQPNSLQTLSDNSIVQNEKYT